jgi:hypothetical protein
VRGTGLNTRPVFNEQRKKKQITGNNIYTLQVTIDISLSIRACSSDRLARRDHDRPWRSRRPATVAIRQSKQNRKKKINKYRLTKSLYVIYIYPAMIYANAEEHATKSNAKKKTRIVSASSRDRGRPIGRIGARFGLRSTIPR